MTHSQHLHFRFLSDSLDLYSRINVYRDLVILQMTYYEAKTTEDIMAGLVSL